MTVFGSLSVTTKEYVSEIVLYPDDEILEPYINELENDNYEVMHIKVPIVEFSGKTYAVKSYKSRIDNQVIVTFFLLGEYVNPNTFETLNKLEEAVQSILYGTFVEMKEILNHSGQDIALIHSIRMGVVYNEDTGLFNIYRILRGAFG